MSCQICGKDYTNESCKWCKPCWINNLKNDFTNWTSGNEKIDDFIQEMKLKFDDSDVVFEWIPYNQFNDIEEIIKDTVYTGIWEDGALCYDGENEEYTK